jgi:hypothetical protein
MKRFEFDAPIKPHETIDSAYIEIPFDVEKEFGRKGQIKVRAQFDGYQYQGSIVKMGHPCHVLGLTQKVRKSIGKNPGDTVHVVVTEDVEPRTVTVPADFAQRLLAYPKAAHFYESLSFTHKREYAEWITSARKVETRNKRIEKALELLEKGKKEPR